MIDGLLALFCGPGLIKWLYDDGGRSGYLRRGKAVRRTLWALILFSLGWPVQGNSFKRPDYVFHPKFDLTISPSFNPIYCLYIEFRIDPTFYSRIQPMRHKE